MNELVEKCKYLADKFHKENDDFIRYVNKETFDILSKAEKGEYNKLLVGYGDDMSNKLATHFEKIGFKVYRFAGNWRIDWSMKNEI